MMHPESTSFHFKVISFWWLTTGMVGFLAVVYLVVDAGGFVVSFWLILAIFLAAVRVLLVTVVFIPRRSTCSGSFPAALLKIAPRKALISNCLFF